MTSFIVVIVSAIIYLALDFSIMKADKIKSIKSISKVIRTNTISPLLFDDADAAAETLLDLKSDPDIINAYILDEKGEVFATYNKNTNQKVDFIKFMDVKSAESNTKKEKNSLYFFNKIEQQNEFLGTVCIKTSLDNLYNQLYKKIKWTFLIILASIILSFIFASIFQKYISRPILNLVGLMEKVSKTKDFSLRSTEYSKDEIGVLTKEFNQLLEQIQKHDDYLIEANSLLESKVKERTAELEEKNEILILARAQAENSKLVKEQFLASMSHEIRTPLNAIIGFQDLLKSTKLNLEQKEYVNSIDFAGRNLLVIINDILDISKIEAGKFIFEETEINIAETLRSVIELVEFRAIEKKINISYHVDDKIPEFVLGDGTRLIQILLNLIGNAIKFTEKGNINVVIELANTDAKNITCKFSIKDTGIGISKDNLKSIFERFNQASSETNRKYGGTGLGLTIVQQLVELQGGKISVESIINEGSTFSFELQFKKIGQKISDKKEKGFQELA